MTGEMYPKAEAGARIHALRSDGYEDGESEAPSPDGAALSTQLACLGKCIDDVHKLAVGLCQRLEPVLMAERAIGGCHSGGATEEPESVACPRAQQVGELARNVTYIGVMLRSTMERLDC